MQGYDPDGNDSGCKVKSIQREDFFVAVGSTRRAKLDGLSHAKILASLGRKSADKRVFRAEYDDGG